MTRPYDGGRAFPTSGLEGMSYRQWLAGLALQGLTAEEGHIGTDDDAEEMAANSLRLADALIAAQGLKDPHPPACPF